MTELVAFPSWVTPSGMTTFRIAVASNAFLPIVVSPEGSCATPSSTPAAPWPSLYTSAVASEVQPEKADSPICRSVSFRVTFVSDALFANASSPIVVTTGRYTSRRSQPLKASSPTSVTFDRSAVCSDAAPEKIPSGSSATSFRMTSVSPLLLKGLKLEVVEGL